MNKICEDALVGEMKGGRTWVFLAIVGRRGRDRPDHRHVGALASAP